MTNTDGCGPGELLIQAETDFENGWLASCVSDPKTQTAKLVLYPTKITVHGENGCQEWRAAIARLEED